MSDIDVDALTREFFGQGMEPWRGRDWCEWAIDKDVAAAKERGLVAFVAARVEQDVADRIERAMFGDTDGGWVSDDSELPVGELRRLLSLARGGSDVG